MMHLIYGKTLLDGAIISDFNSSIVIPEKDKKTGLVKLVLAKKQEIGRIMVYNPWLTKISRVLNPIFHCHDFVLRQDPGFRILSHLESEKEGLTREVSYEEALRYIWYPDIYSLMRGQLVSREVREILAGTVYQVTQAGSEKMRLVQKPDSQNSSTWFFGGGWSFRRRKPLHA